MFSKINHVAIVNHVAMRTLRPAEVADFFRNVFELAPTNKKSDDPNHYLTDGHVTLVIMPWDITDYEGTGIITPGMDHIGFKVENIDAFKQDVERIAADNPRLAPAPMTGAEGKALERLFRRSCPLGQHQMADCDGILTDIAADWASSRPVAGRRSDASGGSIERRRTCGSPASDGPRRRRLLQEPPNRVDPQRRCGRWLRELRARVCAVLEQAHRGQSQHHHPAHARRRWHSRHEISLLGRAQGRHRA